MLKDKYFPHLIITTAMEVIQFLSVSSGDIKHEKAEVLK